MSSRSVMPDRALRRRRASSRGRSRRRGACRRRSAGGQRSCPRRAAHARRCRGPAVIVSTLFTIVGCPNAPMTAGNGGLSRGSPRLPSSDLSIAVSSPQMYAPAPGCVHTSIAWSRPERPRTDVTLGARLRERLVQPVDATLELTAHVDPNTMCAPIAQHVIRIPSMKRCGSLHHDRAVLERPRLALVRVDHEVDLLARLRAEEAPLHARGKARAAAPADRRPS